MQLPEDGGFVWHAANAVWISPRLGRAISLETVCRHNAEWLDLPEHCVRNELATIVLHNRLAIARLAENVAVGSSMMLTVKAKRADLRRLQRQGRWLRTAPTVAPGRAAN